MTGEVWTSAVRVRVVAASNISFRAGSVVSRP